MNQQRNKRTKKKQEIKLKAVIKAVWNAYCRFFFTVFSFNDTLYRIELLAHSFRYQSHW